MKESSRRSQVNTLTNSIKLAHIVPMLPINVAIEVCSPQALRLGNLVACIAWAVPQTWRYNTCRLNLSALGTIPCGLEQSKRRANSLRPASQWRRLRLCTIMSVQHAKF